MAPSFQITPVTIAIYLQIKLDVIPCRTKAEATHCEVGTAHNGFFNAVVGDVIHLAVQ